MPAKKGAHIMPSPEKMKEEIRKMAQRIYSERKSKHLPGDELSDWLAAEAKVKEKRAQ